MTQATRGMPNPPAKATSALPAPPQAGRADVAVDPSRSWNDDDARGGGAGNQREVKDRVPFSTSGRQRGARAPLIPSPSVFSLAGLSPALVGPCGASSSLAGRGSVP